MSTGYQILQAFLGHIPGSFTQTMSNFWELDQDFNSEINFVFQHFDFKILTNFLAFPKY